MWLLLLPPLLVIASLTFLLWYLAKKQYDPTVQAEMLRMSTLESESMMSFKAVFWSFLEKMMKRFKVVSLRLHNTLSEWSHLARKQKEHNKRDLGQSQEISQVSSAELASERAVPYTDMTRKEEIKSDFLETPIMRVSREENLSEESKNEPVAVKTNLGDVKKTKPGHEEDYIAAIATNPKDFTAYEKLGDYYMDNGNIKDAKECYRQVLRLSPSHTEVKMKIRRLEKMLG